MKLAFVNQAIDSILPPYQNSVGACTYGAARALAKSCDVVVYGRRGSHFGIQARDGAERVEQGVQFRLLPSPRSDDWLYQARKKYARIAPRSAPVSSSRWLFPGYGRQVAMNLREQPCDVIHIQHCSQYVPVIRAFNPAAKIVLHLHAEWFSQGGRAVFERRLRGVDLVTAVSDYVAVKTRRDFPEIADRCETMHNGIDAAEFAREKRYLPAAHGREKRILYAGAISPHRGIHVLIDAFRTVAERHPEARLDLVGPVGNYLPQETFDIRDRSSMRSLAHFYETPASLLKNRLFPGCSKTPPYLAMLRSKLPPELAEKVVFYGWLGHRPDMIERYYRADIFVFPSICNDSFGIPPVEAMAAGIPVVATRSGGVVETVKDGETGWIVEKNDAQGLARALLKLLEDNALRESMGRAGRRRAMENFTWSRVAERMRARYEDLRGGPARPPAPALLTAS